MFLWYVVIVCGGMCCVCGVSVVCVEVGWMGGHVLCVVWNVGFVWGYVLCMWCVVCVCEMCLCGMHAWCMCGMCGLCGGMLCVIYVCGVLCVCHGFQQGL